MAVQAVVRPTWYAKFQPSRFNENDAQEYERKISALLPEITGALVVVSALDSDMHAPMNHLVRQVYNPDDKMSKAIILLESSRNEGIQAMADCLEVVRPFWSGLNQTYLRYVKQIYQCTEKQC